MALRFVILGEVAEADRALLSAVAAEEGVETVFRETETEARTDGAGPTSGYISFLPCNAASITRLLRSIPLGGDEHFPVFQMVDSGEWPDFLRALPVSGVFQLPLTQAHVLTMFGVFASSQCLAEQNRGLIREVVKYRKQKQRLLKIGAALSYQDDLDRLLELILTESRDLMNADAGSIYVRERLGPGKAFTDMIRFKISQNDSVEVVEKTREFSIPVDKNTIAGYVAYTGRPANIDDVYELDDSVPYKFGKDFDKRLGYRMKSMLTVPLKNFDGTVVGVLQLMNKRTEGLEKLSAPQDVADEVVSFSYADEESLVSIASLAAVSIERAQLHENIRQIFEGFLSSSIAAIDERDRATSGHSRRVMGYAMAFVEEINATHDGPFAAVTYSEQRKRQFKFAALLHDIGKIGVPEGILTKESRLSSGELGAVLARLDCASIQLSAGRDDICLPWKSLEEVAADRALIERVNPAGFLTDEDLGRVKAMMGKYYIDWNGEHVPILTEEELDSLSVRRGNLTEEERQQINFHATATWRILSKIPWTEELDQIPDIAAHHHERLDGTGYPDGLSCEEIPLESKILAVIDIYEALVAQDRPYKPAMPSTKAVAILHAEVKAGHLDAEIVDFFLSKGIHKIFLDQLPDAQ